MQKRPVRPCDFKLHTIADLPTMGKAADHQGACAAGGHGQMRALCANCIIIGQGIGKTCCHDICGRRGQCRVPELGRVEAAMPLSTLIERINQSAIVA